MRRRRLHVGVTDPVTSGHGTTQIETGHQHAIGASSDPAARNRVGEAPAFAPRGLETGTAIALAPPPISRDALPSADEVRQPLSFLRILLVLVVAGAIGGGIYLGIKRHVIFAPAVRTSTWFAPYVDVTATPTYAFQNPGTNPAREVVLSFITASSRTSCTPSWGGAYSLTAADLNLNVANRIAEYASQGGTAIVSFGGQAHTPLAQACSSASGLAAAYEQVIQHYNVKVIDLDVEGSSGLGSLAVDQRRATAVRAVQVWAQQHHLPLQIWLTLPVEPGGLQANAQTAIMTMLRARDALSGVNVMAMDFSSVPSGQGGMLQAVESSLTSSAQQLSADFSKVGLQTSGSAVWRRLGVTVMIGQNNQPGQRFTTADASTLTKFGAARGLGRVSFWSLNRDRQCGGIYPITGLETTTCSGTPQATLEFSKTFDRLTGTVVSQKKAVLPPQPDTNPANAPYPLWSPTVSYPQGYKIVRDGEIYLAKWFNTGQDPAAQVQYSWQTPWELLGPVLPTDHRPKLPRLPAGTYPLWSVTAQYQASAKVLYQGLPYQAKWNNQGISPLVGTATNSGSPWQPLFNVPGEPSTNTSTF